MTRIIIRKRTLKRHSYRGRWTLLLPGLPPWRDKCREYTWPKDIPSLTHSKAVPAARRHDTDSKPTSHQILDGQVQHHTCTITNKSRIIFSLNSIKVLLPLVYLYWKEMFYISHARLLRSCVFLIPQTAKPIAKMVVPIQWLCCRSGCEIKNAPTLWPQRMKMYASGSNIFGVSTRTHARTNTHARMHAHERVRLSYR